MLQLTRFKLERAAQGQLTGRRAAGLRELVLLSNAFVGALAPDWARRDQEEREAIEQQKLDEERWLDGILEEMSVEDEEDEDEAYVELSFRDEREAHDSGFLDPDDAGPKASTSSSSASTSNLLEGSDLLNSVDSIEEDYREGRALGGPHEAELAAIEEEDDDEQQPPKPSRSPPIAVPTSPTRPQTIIDEVDDLCTSCSPPLPGLTPDASPREPAGSILGSSLDSFETQHNLAFDRIDWLQHPQAAKRPGLLSIDTASSSFIRQQETSALALELDPIDQVTLSLEALGRRNSQTELVEESSGSQFGFALVPRSASASPAPQWASPPPARALSLPPLHRAKEPPQSTSTPHPIPSFTSGIVSLWDCVDFGKPPPPIPYFSPSPTRDHHHLSLPSSPERSRDRGRAIKEGESAVVLRRPLPSFPPMASAEGEDDAGVSVMGSGRMGRSPWRARSMSPGSTQQRSSWSSLAAFDLA